MSITFPEGAIVKTIIINAYAALILLVLALGFPVFLHGYRQLWVDILYGTAAVGTITGITGRYRMVRRNRKSSSRREPPPTSPTMPDISHPTGEMPVDVHGPVAGARRTDTKV
jgi:hypothetical protein